MKKVGLAGLVVLLLSLVLSGCASDSSNVKEKRTATLRAMNGLGDGTEGSRKAVTDPEEIAMWHKAIKDAVPEPGIVNMAEPQYQVELGDSVHYLWISEDAGTVMNTGDTHTISTLAPKYAKAVHEAIQRHYPGHTAS
ncbi:hypothetical protein D3P09_23220 [Paenibacillus pinisoli]|uniref:YhfM-like domain-containing protein n=1 Tax=Paenibacillus pinisoli TaxID=1276110 RepID=A0A3A6PGN4_9BACL|nr:hypothetical protein [Paenibacillus pinisoli]RJX37269.1 hypothetical protein D3P09_23220 [Paenibacillus pinisoli]